MNESFLLPFSLHFPSLPLLAWGQYTGGGPICMGPLGGGDPEPRCTWTGSLHWKNERKVTSQNCLESSHAFEAMTTNDDFLLLWTVNRYRLPVRKSTIVPEEAFFDISWHCLTLHARLEPCPGGPPTGTICLKIREQRRQTWKKMAL